VLAITPGGFQEMSIAAQQMNALLSVVVISHVIRIMTVLFAYPKIIRTALGFIEKRSPSADGEPQENSSDEGESPPKDRVGPARWAAMILGAAAGGVFGVWIGIPAGSVVFAMLGVALVKTMVAAESAAFPTFARRGVQIALGTTLGLQVSLRPLARAGDLVIPLATTLALLLAISLATGLFIYRFTRTDLASALWMSAPGGLMEIMVLAEAMDLDVLPILTVHTMRVLLIIAIQPSLVLALSNAL
jgi:membrane AbrB-like protein